MTPQYINLTFKQAPKASVAVNGPNQLSLLGDDEMGEQAEQWEYRLAQVVAFNGDWAYLIVGGEPHTDDDQLVPFNRVETEGWRVESQLFDALLFDASGNPLRGYSPVLLLKRRKP